MASTVIYQKRGDDKVKIMETPDLSPYAIKADVDAELAEKANIDGYYSDMTVGNAEQLISNDYVTDQTPYVFRTAGGDADIGNREYDTLIGGTMCWNQLNVDNNTFTKWAGNAQISVVKSDNTLVATAQEGATTAAYFYIGSNRNPTPLVVGHKYLAKADIKTDGGKVKIQIGFAGSGSTNNLTKNVTPDTRTIMSGIMEAVTGTNSAIGIYPFNDTAPSEGDTATLYSFEYFDLTQMFGTAIADHVYALETANAGAGVAWFRRLFPKDYYAYDPGSLQSVQAASHDMVGFNAYDNTSGTAVLLGGKQYQITGTYTALAYSTGETITPDSDGLFTPTENGTLTVTGGNATDTCVHLVWSGYRNGEYEPYEKHSYPLDSTLTLRGVPYLDASGNMVYNGDTYESDGTVTRRYGIVDLGTRTWSYNTSYAVPIFTNLLQSGFPHTDTTIKLKAICTKYVNNYSGFASLVDKSFTLYYGTISGTDNPATRIALRDDDYTDADILKTALSGVYLVYEITTPTTEAADAFQSPQIVSDFGTEEYVDAGVAAGTRDVAIPVGHDTRYMANLVDKLRRLPDAPDTAGDYLVHYNAETRRASYAAYTDGGRITALESMLPSPPVADGTYKLTATIADGEVTYSWEA